MRTFLLLFLVLAGCASTQPMIYGPAGDDGYGYFDQAIEDDRVRVIVNGSGGAPVSLLEDYALRRASELTLDAGFDWFRIVDKVIDGEERGGVSIGAGVGSGSYGRRGGVSVGAGGDFGRIGSARYYQVRMEVLFGAGDTPNDPDVYDARAVLARFAGPEG